MSDKNFAYYKAFGLNIKSAIICPNLPASDGNPEVDIVFDKLPMVINQTPNCFLLDIQNIARYLIEEGRKITIDSYANASEQDVRLFLMGSAMGALLHQRGFLVLHACAVKTKWGVFAFVAESGTGKSTLATAFYQRGFALYSDDVCVVDVAKDGLVYPGYEQIKLWQASMDNYGMVCENYERVANRFDKFIMPISQKNLNPAPLYAVCELLVGDDLMFEAVTGMDKIEILLKHTYRNQYLAPMARLPDHLKLCNQVVDKIQMAKITRPQQGFSAHQILDLVIERFSLSESQLVV